MDNELLDDIYLTLTGQLIPGAAVPRVPNLFAPYGYCERAYTKMQETYERLCARLGVDVDDEDDDLNCMVDSLESIQKVLCKEMFLLGMTYGQSTRRILTGNGHDTQWNVDAIPAKTAPDVSPGLLLYIIIM